MIIFLYIKFKNKLKIKKLKDILLSENEIMLNVLYFDMHEIIAIKRNIYYKVEYISNIKALNSIEPRIKKVNWNHNTIFFFISLYSHN